MRLRPLPLVAGLLALAAAALGALAAAALGALAAAAAGEERRTVAILPVVVHAVEEQAYLRDGLADMLASRLGQQPGIGVIRVSDPAAATLEPEAARAAGRAVGAQWVLYGSFTRFGEGASLDVQCIPVAAPGEPSPRSIFVQSGRLADLIPRLDGLAERVALHVLGRDAATPGAAANANGVGRAELDELRRRVEALERAAAAATPSAAQAAPEAQP
jgi:outer membrane protein insertion porin family